MPNLSPTQHRAYLLRKFCDIKSGVGLEFGPLANPIVAKSEGQVYYVDHLSTERLRTKYSNDPTIQRVKIVPVDIVLYQDFEVLGAFQPFDYVIASHVFEHLANPIGWLQDLSRYLNPNATIALAIPDKRYTFDRLRNPTRPSEVLANYLNRLEKPSLGQVLDHFLNVAHVDTRQAWDTELQDSQVKRKYDIAKATAIAARALVEYVDCHCTVWTVESFVSVWSEISHTSLLSQFRLEQIFEPVRFGNDFVVILKRN